MSSYLPNFFKAYLAVALPAGSTVAQVVVDRITTLNGETIETADLSVLGAGYLTANPDGDGATSYPETIRFTGITAVSKTLTGATRGISKAGIEDEDLMRYHPIGTPVIISLGTQNISDIITYLNSLVVSTRSVIVTGTAGETITGGNLIYFDDPDNEWKKCDADNAATVENVMLGIAQGSGVDGGSIAGGILLLGKDLTNSGLTPGTKYYASNTAGGLSTSAGTNEVSIGYGTVDGYLYVNPRFDQMITESIQDALAGSSGTPSGANKFVTEEGLAAQNLTPTGMFVSYAGLTAPSGWLLCNGAAVSRTTYATLLAALMPTLGTVTITLASPGVVTKAAHGLATGDSIYLTTTGALPTGLAVNTRYWVVKNDANTFWLSTSLANALAGTKINTSVSQSGVHTAVYCPYGLGDGSTTFNVPDMSGKVAVGVNQSDAEFAGHGQTGGEKTHTLSIAEMPAHNHTGSYNTGGYGGGGASGVAASNGGMNNFFDTQNVPSQGGDGAHNNLQPYLSTRYIIKT